MNRILYKGPDLSKHNGDVNIKSIRDAGYKRIGIRVGYGKNNIDQKYVQNASACVNLQVPILAYWFSYAYTVAMAAQEAQFCIAQLKKHWTCCPVAFDLEYDTIRYARTKGVNINKKQATDMAIAFLKVVKGAGYIPVLYTNRDYLLNYFELERITKEVGHVYVWYARYTGFLPSAEENIPDVWQYTSKARINGVNGNVDMNHFFTDFVFEAEAAVQKPAVCNTNILNFQRAANLDGYRDQMGQALAEDGIDGAKTQYVRRKICLQTKHVGPVHKAGSTGEVVKWWQTRCNEILGHHQKVDGKYGNMARNETIALQKKLNLTIDGKAGYNSLQAVFYN